MKNVKDHLSYMRSSVEYLFQRLTETPAIIEEVRSGSSKAKDLGTYNNLSLRAIQELREQALKLNGSLKELVGRTEFENGDEVKGQK